MVVSGSLVAMWILYIAFGIFPIVYITLKGREK